MSTLIGICGATGTGKSTVCKKIASEDNDYRHIALDNFFFGTSSYSKKTGFIDMEQPGCTDFYSAYHALFNLKTGNNAVIPRFSKKEDRIIGSQLIENSRITLIDGYHAFYDPRIRELFDLKIYMKADENIIKRRRQERDQGCSDEYFYNIILPEYRRYVGTYENFADIIIDANPDIDKVAEKVKKTIENYLSDNNSK